MIKLQRDRSFEIFQDYLFRDGIIAIMKVTVCFGAIKVIVPCGEGTLSVGELIDKSVQRYKKATGRVSLCSLNLSHSNNNR